MAKAENDKVVRPAVWGALFTDDRVSRNATEAARELDEEQNRSVVNIARALEEITDVSTRTDLQTRMLILEEQVERLNNRRDEIDQAIESKLSILRTTIESALEAIGAPEMLLAEPPAAGVKTIEPPIQSPVAPAPAAEPVLEAIAQAAETLQWPPAGDPAPAGAIEALRREFEEKLLQARSDLRFEIMRVEKAAGAGSVEGLSGQLEDRIRASEEKASGAAGYLQEMIVAQQTEFRRQKTEHALLMDRLAGELAGFARFLAGAQAGERER